MMSNLPYQETSLLNFSVRVRKSEAKDTMIQWLGMDLFEVPDKSQKGGLGILAYTIDVDLNGG